MTIRIAKEFSTAPGPRYRSEGKHSGEQFREEILRPKIEEADRQSVLLTIDLDGTAGFGTSFLEEAFGGLIREDKYTLEHLRQRLRFVSNEEPHLLEEITEYMEDADKEAA